YIPRVIPQEGKLSRWEVDGRTIEHGTNAGAATPREYRELHDIEGRLAHMDRLGIDTQILYPSMLSTDETPEVEAAMWRSYNRWVADACTGSHDRLRWTCRLPFTTIDAATTELRWAKQHGACGVFVRPIEHQRLL